MEINPAIRTLGSIRVLRIHEAIRPVEAIRPLTAGQVRTPADPSLAPGVRRSDSLQLYVRAADRIEAATAVHLGRVVDRRV